MPGLVSRLIYALIGAKRTEAHVTETGRAPNAAPAPRAGESKDWIPDIQHKQVGERRDRSPAEVPAHPHAPESDEGGIDKMMQHAYAKTAGTFQEKLKKKDATTGMALAVIAAVILSMTPFFSYMKAVLIIFALILIAATSKLIQKLFPFVVGFDLCLFFTVITGVAYNPIAGIIVGVISSTFGSVVRGQHDALHVIMPDIGYIIVGLSIPFFSGNSIFYTGMASAVLYAIIMSSIFWFIRHCPSNTLTFFLTTVGFNYWLFSNYAAWLLGMM